MVMSLVMSMVMSMVIAAAIVSHQAHSTRAGGEPAGTRLVGRAVDDGQMVLHRGAHAADGGGDAGQQLAL